MNPDTYSKTLNLHCSFWLHWFPSSLILLNLDTYLQSSKAVTLMSRLKKFRGAKVMIALVLLLSFAIGFPLLQSLDWPAIGFVDCDNFTTWSIGMPYVFACLPFEVATFFALHLALAPDTADTADVQESLVDSKLLKSIQQLTQPFSQIIDMTSSCIRSICDNLRETGFAFNLWHQIVESFFRTFHPAWSGLFPATQKRRSTLEMQLFFFAPMATMTWLLAWCTYHFLEKPSSRLLRKFSEKLNDQILAIAVTGYLCLCCSIWWTQLMHF